MIKLFGFRVSNYHNKVLLALHEKGIAFEEDASIRPSQDPALLERSPLGKVPFAEIDGTRLCESEVICEYLEEAFPDKPALLPREPLARAKVRELVTVIELHMELVARRLYGAAFFGGTVSDEVKAAVQADLAKGVRAFKALAKFDPFVAGRELTLADCSAAVHLPLVSMATKIVYGKDVLEELAQVKPYLKLLGQRPAFAKVAADRKSAQDAMLRPKA